MLIISMVEKEWELRNRRQSQVQKLFLTIFTLCLTVALISLPRQYRHSFSPYYNTQILQHILHEKNELRLPKDKPKTGISCDLSNYRTAVCRLTGDVRISGNNTAMLVNRDGNATEEEVAVEKIKPYPRKWQKELLKKIGEVTVKSVPALSEHTPPCDIRHKYPAVIFSTGGYTGSVYHDFNDGLIPIYITSHMYMRKVVFLILEYKPWWMKKYGGIIRQMTEYPAIDLSTNSKVHCFPGVVVGLQIHDELAIDSSRMTSGQSIRDFQSLLKSAFSPPVKTLNVKPRLLLITRRRTRVFNNEKEIIKLANQVGFQVKAFEPGFNLGMPEMYGIVQSSDVLVGIHGAAMTHLLFMRPGTLLLQVVPLGTASPSFTFYGNPALKAGLQYMEYRILPTESSLADELGLNHTKVVNPPKNPGSSGWMEMKELYLDRQNVTISIQRFKPVLEEAFAKVSSGRKSN